MNFSDKFFNGRINGVTVRELNRKVDYTKTKLEDRKQVVEEILSSGYYTRYFDEQYKASITSNCDLSDENAVCRSLERMANYLLNSEEAKENEKRVYHTDTQYFNNKMNREQSIESRFNINEDEDSGMVDNIIHSNTAIGTVKYSKAMEITKEDLERNDKLGEILREYNDYIKHIEKNGKNKIVIDQQKSIIKKDMIEIKRILNPVISTNPSSNNSEINYHDIFDFSNPIHLCGGTYKNKKGQNVRARGLLYFLPDNNISDFSHVLMDLQDLIDRSGLNSLEKRVLYLMRKNYYNKQIAQEIGVNQHKVATLINNIVKKIQRKNKEDF